MDLFKIAVFMLAFERMKTELLENSAVKVSIYTPPEHALGSLGITRRPFVYLFSDFECHSVFAWTGMISKTLLLLTRIYFHTDKKDVFSKIYGYVRTGPQKFAPVVYDILRCIQIYSYKA